jgi:hypothetical protein
VLLRLNYTGYQCIDERMNCLGFTHDEVYFDGDEPLALLSAGDTDIRNGSGSSPHAHSSNSGAGSNNSNHSMRSSRTGSGGGLSSGARGTPSGLGFGVRPHGPWFLLGNRSGDFIVVVGVLHSDPQLRKASYSNVAVYNAVRSMGVGAVMDTALRGSARQYDNATAAPAASGSDGLLYAYKFQRECASPYCWAVPTAFPGVGYDEPLTFVERAVLEPATGVGPDPFELIPPTVLHFRRARKQTMKEKREEEAASDDA